jgi:hypothetical protein
LQKIAGNINFSYDFEDKVNDGEINDIEFFITIANIHPDIYVNDTYKKANYYYVNSPIIRNGDYISGLTITFKIYSNIDNCKNELIYNKYLNLPYYNRYYNDEACKGIEKYQLCQRWQKTGLSYSQFIKKIKDYKESLNVNPGPVGPDKPDNKFDYELIYQFISKYYFIILVSIITVCLSAIVYLNKKNNFDLK